METIKLVDERVGVDLVIHKTTQVDAMSKWVPKFLALGKFLLETDIHGDTNVAIYAYESETIGGIRIAEIGYTRGNAGASYMRSDADAAAVILRAEDFLLTHGETPHRPAGWDSFLNEHGEARCALRRLIEGEEAANAEYEKQLKEEKKLIGTEHDHNSEAANKSVL